jgi:hypothetical protein
MANTGFGAELRQALKTRQRWLLARGLAEDAGDCETPSIRPEIDQIESLGIPKGRIF